MTEKTLIIDEDARTVSCKPVGGSLKVPPECKIRWRCGSKPFTFRLTFRVVPIDGIATPADPWPFGTDPPPARGGNSTEWITVGEFEGTVAVQDGVFKYDIEVPGEGGLAVLDPMIIVGR